MIRRASLAEIINKANLKHSGADIEINGLNLCNRESEYDAVLSYITDIKYLKHVDRNISVKAILVPSQLYDEISGHRFERNVVIIPSENPEEDFYNIHEYLYEQTDFYDKFTAKKQLGNNCKIADTAIISDGCVIGDNAKIGANTVILPGTYIGSNVEIGCNTSLGVEGLQAIRREKGNRLITHTGKLIIGDNVSIGSNVVMSRSLFDGATTIGNGVIIDSLTSIAHNISIGDSCVVVSGSFFCGGCTIGKNVWVGPNSTIMNKVKIGDNAKIGIGSVVTKNVKDGASVFGNPAVAM